MYSLLSSIFPQMLAIVGRLLEFRVKQPAGGGKYLFLHLQLNTFSWLTLNFLEDIQRTNQQSYAMVAITTIQKS